VRPLSAHVGGTPGTIEVWLPRPAQNANARQAPSTNPEGY
jgi:hypothetical protein